MQLTSGEHSFGPRQGTLTVRTGRQGAAARMGHDLTLEARDWSATVVVDAADITRSSLEASIDAGSLEVVDASGGALGLSDSQRAEIVQTIRTKVLAVDRHPHITFRSTGITGDERAATVTGQLTVAGKTRVAKVTMAVNAAGTSITGTASIVQTRFGIKPYSAMLGALRVKDEVLVEVTVRLSRT